MSIGAVSADDSIVDNNTLSQPVLDDVGLDSTDSSVESSINDENVLSAASGTFSDLQGLINSKPAGSTVDLDMNYVYSPSVDSSLVTGVVIDKPLIINGHGYYINGSNTARILDINANGVSLLNTNFVNGYRPSSGEAAAILWKGNNALVQYCNFTDNGQEMYAWKYGLCIFSTGSFVTIDHCIFKSTAGVTMFSGVHLDGDNIQITCSTFTRINTAIQMPNSGKVNITGCSFEKPFQARYSISSDGTITSYFGNMIMFASLDTLIFNKNNVNYGSVWDYLNSYALSLNGVNEVEFIDNYIYHYSRGSEVIISNVKKSIYVYNNHFYRCGGGSSWSGHIITVSSNVNYNATAVFLKNNFTRPQSSAGSVIRVVSFTNSNITLNKMTTVTAHAIRVESSINSFISYNEVSTLASYRALTVLNVANCTFIHNNFNSVNSPMSVAYVENSNMTFENNLFFKCYANTDTTTLYGCLFRGVNSNFTFNSNTFDSCYCILEGSYGAIHFDEKCIVNCTNNIFRNNRFNATVNQGTIFNQASNSIFYNNNFTGNNITGYGAGIYNDANNVNITYNNFTSNYAYTAGSVYNSGDDVDMRNNIFIGNHADNVGVIYTDGDNVDISYNNFTNCYATGDMGVLSIGGVADVYLNNFTNCYAGNSYGVIFSQNADGSHIHTNNYTNNYANSEGIVVLGGGVTMDNENFNHNHVNNGICGVVRITGDNNILNNTNITNANATSGGAIYNTGNNNILDNCMIINTTATSSYGGAIYSSGNYLTINNLKIYNSSSAQDGGALYITGISTILTHASFDNTSSNYDGGAIYWYGSEGNGYDINITNVNTTRNGGAINWVGANGILSKINIANATAKGDGGAIYWTGTNGEISDLTLLNINATTGGAIYWTGNYGKIRTATFNDIHAVSDGGAIYWIGSSATLNNINFTKINSGGSGGAIYGTSGDSTMDDLSFNDINSTNNGGAISWSGSNSILNNIIFTNIYSPANGGAIYWTGDKSRITNARFKNITAGGNGGSIYWTGILSNLTNINITNSNANGSGGAIHWTGNNGTVTQLYFKENNANSGAGIYWCADGGKIYNANFTSNNATNNGGAIYLIGDSLTLFNLNISKNTAKFKGGAIYLIGSYAKLYNLNVSDNNAGADSGALSWDGVYGELYDSNFINNTASANGGAISWLGANAEVHNVNFTKNNASSGGAIYWSADNANIYQVNFINNTAVTGGAAYIGGITGSSMKDANFTGNNATSYGGSIYWSCSKGNLSNVNIDKSNAIDGGAIYWAGTDSIITSLTFNNTNASNNGGIIYILASRVNITNVSFSNSQAFEGGAIYWTGHEGKLENSNFINNTASNNGGALCIIGNAFQLSNSNFTHNNASNFGGAIYWAGSGNITSTELTYNRAYYGSAIYNAGSLDIYNTTVLKNKANITSIEITKNEDMYTYSITTVLHGGDNFLNGLWTTSNNIQVQNVTYWNSTDEVKTENALIRPVSGSSENQLYYDSRLNNFNTTVTVKNTVTGNTMIQTGSSDINGTYITNPEPKVGGLYSITTSYEEDDYYAEFSDYMTDYIGAATPTLILRLNKNEISYGTNLTFEISLTASNENGTLSPNATIQIYVDDEYQFDVNITDGGGYMGGGLVSFAFPIDAGDHNITAIYGGNSVYPVIASTNTTQNFTVTRIPMTVNVNGNASTIFVDELINITITVPTIYDGAVRYIVGNYSDIVNVSNGSYSFTTSYGENATVTVFAYAEGDTNYLPGMGVFSFEVIKKYVDIKFNTTGTNLNPINVGDPAIIKLNLNVSDATGNIIINLNGINYTAVIDGDTATVTIYNLTSNNLDTWSYPVTANYEGDKKYYPTAQQMTILKVNKLNVDINATSDARNIIVGENVVFNIKVNSTTPGYPVNGYVIVKLGGKNYNVSIINDTGLLTINGLNEGNYSMNIDYYGDIQFNPNSVTNILNFTVTKYNINSITVNYTSPIKVGQDAILNISIQPEDNYNITGYVTVNINNKDYNVSISNNKGVLNVTGLNEGIYYVNVSYAGDNKFNPKNASGIGPIIVNKVNVRDIIITPNHYNVNVGENIEFNVTVVSDNLDYKINGYVTINIDNNNYNVSINEGKGHFTVSNLANGTYKVNALYAGDNTFNPLNSTNLATIIVEKVDIFKINVTPKNSNITVGDNAEFIIEVITERPDDYNVTGYVTVIINNNEYKASVIEGIGSLIIPELGNGTYKIGVNYTGDNVYNPWYVSDLNSITVNKVNIESITITPVNQTIYIGEDALFDITVTTELPQYSVYGYITVTVAGQKYNVSINNGKGSLNVPNLAQGKYSVDGDYKGNKVYNSWSDTNLATVIVVKINVSSIEMSPVKSPVYVGQEVLFNIKMNPEKLAINGYVTVSFNGNNYNVSIINNTGLFSVSGLSNGTYDVNISYAGDAQFNALRINNVSSVKVDKVDILSINVNPVKSPIYVGENAIFNINITSVLRDEKIVDGFATVTIDNKKYNVSIVNGIGSFSVPNLAQGNYPVSIYYAGDDVFNERNIDFASYVVVNKVDINSIEINDNSPINVGDDAIININIISNDPVNYIVNGYATVNINNENYNVSINNGTGSLIVRGLSEGKYPINVIYNGDNVYNAKTSNEANIIVNKIPTTIQMNNVELNVGDNAVITAIIDDNTVSGNVTFIVDNKKYTVGIVDGVARLNVMGLNTSANKIITAIYSGDYKFKNSSATAELIINKVNSNASIIVYDITAGETENIIINLPSDVTNGTIIVKFNDWDVSDYSIVNNVITFNRTIQISGEYNVYVAVINDCKYNDFNNQTSFIVSKVSADDYKISIDINDTHVFENIPVIISLPNDANGLLKLSVDDKIPIIVNVINGTGSYVLGNLSYGNHTVKVIYDDDKYDEKTVSATVFVDKIASDINVICPTDSKVAHQISIKVMPEGSTGAITSKINDVDYDVVNNTIDASDLLEGNYTVVVNLEGDDNFFPSYAIATFTVTRNDVDIVLNRIYDRVFVGADTILHVDFDKNLSGDVIFNINGMNYTITVNNTNFAEYNWIPTESGNITLNAYYAGNDIYYSVYSNAIMVNVFKNPVEFTEIIVNNIMVGDLENITTLLNVSDSTGTVIIEVNGKLYECNAFGGLSFLTLPDLSAGTYNVTVSYSGDVKYLPIESHMVQFIVSKYSTQVYVNVSDIMVLDDEIIVVSVPEDINDLIRISVDNKVIYIPVVNGTAVANISDLSAGEYVVNVEFEGNNKYLDNSPSASFTVSRYNSSYEIIPSGAYWDDQDVNFTVELSPDATGNVTVNVDGVDYVSPVINGSAEFNIPKLNPGNYTAAVSYSGDYKYDNLSDEFNFDVNLNYLILESDNVTKYYKGSERLYINLTNARGDKLANQTIYITVNGITYTRITNENGSLSLAINLPSGEYDALIEYNSSQNNSISKIVDVVVLSTIGSSDLIKVYRNDSQFWVYLTDSEGNALANTNVTFNINGVFYTRTTNASGWAKLNINLPQGEYIITSYNSVTGETCSNKVMVLSKITENYDLTKYYGDGTPFTACIIGNDGEHVGEGVEVTFNINGVFYNRITNSTGYVKLNINLPQGEYIITTYYDGCVVSNKITILNNGGL